MSLARAPETLWDVEDSDRFAKLAILYPELLTYGEQKVWTIVSESDAYWKGNSRDLATFEFKVLRDRWELAKRIHDGHASEADV